MFSLLGCIPAAIIAVLAAWLFGVSWWFLFGVVLVFVALIVWMIITGSDNQISDKQHNLLNTMPVALGGVIMSQSSLYQPGSDGGGTLLVFSDDPNFVLNEDWLAATIQNVIDADGSDRQVQDFLNYVDNFANSQMGNYGKRYPLPMSLTDGVTAYCLAQYYDSDSLPNGYIPSHRILPIMIDEKKRQILVIPPSLYL